MCRTGQGTFIWVDGIICWRMLIMNATDKTLFGSGNKYVGEYLNSERTGQELILEKVNGRIKCGESLNRKRHGQGTYFYSNGNSIGQWKMVMRRSRNLYLGRWR